MSETSISTRPPSPFVWYELMTSDAVAAQAFYAQVVGWSTQDAGMPGMSYTLLQAGGHAVAGLMALPQEACDAGARPGWVGYLAVPEVDAAAERLVGAGAEVLRPAEDIPGVGRFAVVADPQGAVFDLFSPASNEQPPQPDPGTPGTIGWHELQALDLEAAWSFYADQFGWTEVEAMDMGPLGLYRLFATGGEAVGGMMTRLPEVPAPFWLYYFNVADVAVAAEAVRAGGGQVLADPQPVPGGSWICQCLDPQGAMFAVVGPNGQG